MKLGTPHNIELLLHIHLTPEPWPHSGSSAYADGMRMLVNVGAVRERQPRATDAAFSTNYTTTKLGAAWIKALCNVEKPTETICYKDHNGNIL